ncbi:DHA2 family efflux MFS transporter permease subunit [Nisaea acidiphila]|uniref:DHA2 family efflux MFS transporter permease subunit n=1 Tax=Nisaea acidiphila TaxID=1862145 RepID=A0A9J7AYU8_9PROT|nr:DHA2 family efflux MFS transporter permease subunit [Nisaea acidiphila]UUX51609.1 DHA2 family efflux MFS transporter permease subunit [Nisaea acidiphila]
MSAITATEETQADGAYKMLVLVTMACACMLYALTLTIVNVALPQMQGAFSATTEEISWVVTLNVVATAVVTPLTGSLVAWVGQRRLLVICLLGFTLASLACAMATSLEAVLFFRILQGGFGAPVVPLSQAIVLQVWPKEEYGKANGYLGMSVVIGPAVGPSIGGWLAEEFGWRFVFLMIVPFSLLALAGVMRWIREGGKAALPRFDYLGFLLFSVAIVALQLVLDRGEREDWLQSGTIVTLVIVMCAAFAMFIANSACVERPFIRPSLLKNRNYVVGLFLVFVYGSVNFTPLVLLPQLLQAYRGYPDTLIGLVLAMRGVGMIIGFYAAARMGKLDPRIGLVLGTVAIGTSGWMMSLYDLNMDFWDLSWPSILQGIGCGLMWVPLSMVSFSTLDRALLPEASSLFHLIRNMGTSLYVAASVFLLVRMTKVRYAEMVEHVSPFDERLKFPEVIGGGAVQWLDSLGLIANEAWRQSALTGFTNCFWFYALTCFATLPVLVFVKIRKSD